MSFERPDLPSLRGYHSRIRRRGVEAARRHTEKELQYTVDRGLEDYNDIIGEFPADFNIIGDHQPTSLRRYIEHRLEHLLPGKKLRVLDVGCGKAELFLDLVATYGDMFDCTGVTIADYRDEADKQALAAMGAKYIVGDARELRSLLQRHNAADKYDLATCTLALLYIQPARMRQEIIKTMYRSLAEDGVAAADSIALLPQGLPRDDYRTASAQLVTSLNEMFRQRGLKIQITDNRGGAIHMQKTAEPFYLPIPYDDLGEVVDIRYWNNQVQAGDIDLNNPHDQLGWVNPVV